MLRPHIRPKRRAVPRRRMVAVTACLLAGAAAVGELSSHTTTTPGHTATRPSLRQAILTAFDYASGMVLEVRSTVSADGALAARGVSWWGPTLPRSGTTAWYRFTSMTPGGHPISELAELYTARGPDFRGLGEDSWGSAA